MGWLVDGNSSLLYCIRKLHPVELLRSQTKLSKHEIPNQILPKFLRCSVFIRRVLLGVILGLDIRILNFSGGPHVWKKWAVEI